MIVVRDNLPDFKKQMDALGRDFIPLVRAASRASAREFVRGVRGFAPRKSGTLRRAVVIKRARRGVPRGSVQYIVGIRQGASQQHIKRGKGTVNLDAFYWRFLEGGWTPRRPKSALRGGRRTKALQARRARASGEKVVRYKFIEPGFRASSATALQAFTRTIEDGIRKLQAKG